MVSTVTSHQACPEFVSTGHLGSFCVVFASFPMHAWKNMQLMHARAFTKCFGFLPQSKDRYAGHLQIATVCIVNTDLPANTLQLLWFFTYKFCIFH